jgi:DNA-binding transcriptional LysR family regulator
MNAVNLKDLDLKLLVVFEAIYSTGNISRAADKLAMSQPAVSNLLARLRDLVGDPLFARGQRGVQPTVKAQAMIGPVREALGLIGRQFGQTGAIDLATYRRTFRISMMDPLEPLLLPPVLNLIADRAPGVSIEGIMPRPEFAQDILSGTLELACFAYPLTSPEIVVVPICPVDVVVVARRNHAKIKETLDLDTFRALDHLALVSELRNLTQVDRELLVHDVKRRVVYSVSRVWSMPAIVAETDLVCMLPRAFAMHVAPIFNLAVYEPPVKLPEQYMYMMWHAKMESDPGHEWLRGMLQAVARERLGGEREDRAPNVTPFVRPLAGGQRRAARGQTPPRSA